MGSGIRTSTSKLSKGTSNETSIGEGLETNEALVNFFSRSLFLSRLNPEVGLAESFEVWE